jgi:hypothetical protein
MKSWREKPFLAMMAVEEEGEEELRLSFLEK